MRGWILAAAMGAIAGLVVLLALILPFGPNPDGDVVGGSPSHVADFSRQPTATPVRTVGVVPQVTPSLPPPTRPPTGIEVGDSAPDFSLRTPEGDTLHLSDYLGRPVWINFWAPWCPACRTEMPRLEGFWLQHKDEGLVILGVGVRDDPATMRGYTDEVGVTYPIVVDGDGAVATTYRALALPVHYWIDRGGIVRDWAFGELPPDALAVSLDLILRSESNPNASALPDAAP